MRSLAERYRPRCLEEIVGNEEAIRILRAQVVEPRGGTAWLLHGPSGVGKTSAALCMAEALASPMDRKQLAGPRVGVQDLDELERSWRHYPWGDWHVAVIDEADLMSAQARRALLTLIDRMPESAILILTSNDDAQKWEDRLWSRVHAVEFSRRDFRGPAAGRIWAIAQEIGIGLTIEEAGRLVRDCSLNLRGALRELSVRYELPGREVE